MTRSPNYGRRRSRHPRARDLHVVGFEPGDAGCAVTVAGPQQPPVTFAARDQSAAVCMVDLLKQGAFSLPGRLG